MTSRVTYLGKLRTVCKHLRSGDDFNTDAPVDNNGLGEAFSPTDTVATALASCILTMMGIKARDMNIDLAGATAEVTKYMAAASRRISKIEVVLNLPKNIDDKNRAVLIRTAETCPVHFSLHPDIEKVISYHWSQD